MTPRHKAMIGSHCIDECRIFTVCKFSSKYFGATLKNRLELVRVLW